MSLVRLAPAILVTSLALMQPAFGQSKALIEKAATEFLKQSEAMAAGVAALSKRAATASPRDKEMLNLVVQQLAVVDALADGVAALGLVTGQMRDAGDLTQARKYLASRCTALKSSIEGSTPYVASVANNIAAPALVADVGKATDQMVQLGKMPLCNPAGAKG
jgi:hypothetical protein